MAYDTHRCRQSLVKRSFPSDSRVPEGVVGQFGDRRMVGVCKEAGRKAGFLTEQKGVLMDSDTLFFSRSTQPPYRFMRFWREKYRLP